MNQEVTNWKKQSERDLKSAENSFNSKDYYVSAFLYQQAVEKGLKSVFLKDKKELPKTHNITRLAKELNVPKVIIVKIASLEPIYQETRYPDVSSKILLKNLKKKMLLSF